MDAVQAHFQNTENAPIEETEASYPLRIVRYGLVPDSEGAGRQRGGLGLRRDYVGEGDLIADGHGRAVEPSRRRGCSVASPAGRPTSSSSRGRDAAPLPVEVLGPRARRAT